MGECDLKRLQLQTSKRPRQRVHETPLFMRVLENPVVRNNAAWGRPKSIENFGFSTVFLGFLGFYAENGLFWPIFVTFWSNVTRNLAFFAL